MIDDIQSGAADDRDEFESRFERPDGQTRWFDWTGYPLLEEDNAYSHVGWTTDVTERRDRQKHLEAERDQRSVLFENNPDPVLRVEFDEHDPIRRGSTGRSSVCSGSSPTPSSVRNDLVGGGRRSAWQRTLLRNGAGSVCAVPLLYNSITHGVLTVVADEPDTFSDREVDVPSQLGTSIGYAITALERRPRRFSTRPILSVNRFTNPYEYFDETPSYFSEIHIDTDIRSFSALLLPFIT
ncbi:hypothetical protein [Halorientalis salina]|uniref:hypothetical protein n=1 Tax=Halorientalis salina TaxID=2932266 RepID=UPI0010ACFCA2|nr:hypothetical protein [Halorientalis salina]